jgi:CubicO group peptidase (beta-lactamase class C family)
MFISTKDMARFGLLYMNDGSWNGKQILAPESISKAMQGSSINEKYGYMWWLNRGEGKWENVPEHVFYAAGFGGNFIVVDTENDIVVVTRWLEPSKMGEFMNLLYQNL